MDFVRHSPKGYSFGLRGGCYFVDLEPEAQKEVVNELWEAFEDSAANMGQRSVVLFERLLRLVKQAEAGRIVGFQEDLVILTGCCKYLDGIVGWQYVTEVRSDQGIFERAFDLAISMGEIHHE